MKCFVQIIQYWETSKRLGNRSTDRVITDNPKSFQIKFNKYLFNIFFHFLEINHSKSKIKSTWSYKYCNLFNIPMDEGRVPVSAFLSKNLRRLLRNTRTQSNILNLSWLYLVNPSLLPFPYKYSNWTRRPIDGGIVPLNEL